MPTAASINRVLVVGATGRTGRHVVAAAAARDLTPVALARSADRARTALPGIEIVVGDLASLGRRDQAKLADPGSLTNPVADVDAVIFVHGSDSYQRDDAAQRMPGRQALSLDGVDWVIAGGESGPRHRPVDLDWVRELRDACLAAQVPFFYEQQGGRTSKSGGRDLDGRTWSEFPPTSARSAVPYVAK